jgi:hypothetical protein
MAQIHTKGPTVVLLVLVLLDVVLIVGAALLFPLTALGLATTLTDTIAPGQTIEKAILLGIASAWWLPYLIGGCALALTAFLCYQFVVALGQRGQTERVSEPEQNSSLRIALDNEKRIREQAERERDTAAQLKEHVEKRYGIISQRLDEAQRDYADALKKWAGVVHLIVSYYRIVDLYPSLEKVLEKMEARLPQNSFSSGDPVADFMLTQEANEKDFRAVRPDLIKVVTELKISHGLFNEALSDDKIGWIINDPQQVQDIMKGLDAVSYSLRNDIAEAAIKACPEASYAKQQQKT